jgi:hypothetical protein
VERASLRLLLSLTPWIQTDLLSNVVERVVGHRSVGGVADIGLSSYSPFRRRAANLSDLKTSNNRFRAFNLGPRGT